MISAPHKFWSINFLLHSTYRCLNLAVSSLENLIWYFFPHSDHTQIRRRHAKISNQICWRDKDLGQNFPQTFIFELKLRAHIFSNAQTLSYNSSKKKFIIWTDFSHFHCFGDFSDWATWEMHRIEQSGFCELTASRNFPYGEWYIKMIHFS